MESGNKDVSFSDKVAEKVMKAMEEKQNDKKSKGKKFNLSFGKRITAKAKIKKGYVLVFLIKNNGNLLVDFMQVENQRIILPKVGTYHVADTSYIGYWKGKYPYIILPEWSIEPISKDNIEVEEGKPIKKESLMKSVIEEGKLAIATKIIINEIRLAKMKGKGMKGGSMVWIIIGLAVIGYLIYQSSVGG